MKIVYSLSTTPWFVNNNNLRNQRNASRSDSSSHVLYTHLFIFNSLAFFAWQ